MLVIPAILVSYQSLKDKTLKLVFETNEPSPNELSMIATHSQSFGYLAFNKDEFKQAEKDAIEGLESDYEDFGKTKSQRLKAVLYRNWQSLNEGYEVFDDYYNAKMEKIIIHYKSKLD